MMLLLGRKAVFVKSRHKNSQRGKQPNSAVTKTNVEGQNPKANDAPDVDLYHDENRLNLYDAQMEQNSKTERQGRESRR